MRRIAYLLLLATLTSIPFEDVFKLPGIGTLARVFGLMTFAAWGLSAFSRGTMRRPHLFHTFAYGFVVWVGLSLFWSLDTTSTIERIETFLQLMALSVVAWDLLDSRAAINAAIQSLVLGLWVAAGSLFLNFAQGAEAYYGRFAASGADPNYMSLLLGLGIPLAWYLWLHPGHRMFRLLNILYLPVALVGMGLTGSRGGFVAGFVAIGYVLSTMRRLTFAGFIGLLIAVGAAIGAVSSIVPDTAVDRIASVGDEITEGDLNGRAGIWLEARDAFIERPLIGIGAGASRAALPTGKVGHNVAITVGLELGFVGFVLFAGMIAVALRTAAMTNQPDRRLWFVLFTIWAVGSLSLSLETRKITWLLVSLMVLAPDLARFSTSGGEMRKTLIQGSAGPSAVSRAL